jgi:hypothetical protein
MLTESNNDILFDDLTLITSMHGDSASNNNSIIYNDCDNRVQIENSVNANLDCVNN